MTIPQDEEITDDYLRSLTDARVRWLQTFYPLVINDVSNPKYAVGRRIDAECRRRKLY